METPTPPPRGRGGGHPPTADSLIHQGRAPDGSRRSLCRDGGGQRSEEETYDGEAAGRHSDSFLFTPADTRRALIGQFVFMSWILEPKGDKAERFLTRLTLRTVRDDFHPHHCSLFSTQVPKLEGQGIALNELLHQSMCFRTYREIFPSLDLAKMTFKSHLPQQQQIWEICIINPHFPAGCERIIQVVAKSHFFFFPV